MDATDVFSTEFKSDAETVVQGHYILGGVLVVAILLLSTLKPEGKLKDN